MEKTTNKIKKFPLLLSLIISCVIVVASLFVLGFCGMKIGTSLAGGTQIQIIVSNDANTKQDVQKIRNVLNKNGYTVDSAFVEDKYIAGEENTKYTSKCIVVKIADKNISVEKQEKIKNAIAENLQIEKSNISNFYEITSSVTSKNIMFIGLAVGLVALCLFVFAWIRYDIFAGLSFLLAYLHNIILYLAILIITRVQMTLISLSMAMILTLIMGAVLIAIYEKNREKNKLQLDEKLSITEKMIHSEKETAKPFMFVFFALFIFALLMFFIPVSTVRLTSLNIIFAGVVTIYSTLIIGPGSYAYLLEVSDANKKAVLSRNEKVNKEIKKKIKNNSKSK